MSWTKTRTILLAESTYYRRILKWRKERLNKRHKTNTIFLERGEYGEFHHLYEKLKSCPALFRSYSRVLPETFDYIVEAITPKMKYAETNFQRAISVPERLMLTLRYLATGIQFRQLQYSFRISKSAVAAIVIEVCKAIWETDAGVFENCPLRKAIESGSIVLPEETNLPGSTILAPYVFLGDEAFPLTEYLMRPFPRGQLQEGEENDMFNYRLCRARMVVECSFGAIASKFRILQKAIETNVENAVHIVKAITLLHNIIKDLEGISDMDLVNYRSVTIDPRSYVPPSRIHNASSRKALLARKKFCRFFTFRPLTHA
nr:unnamed protein product [Callosobruchus analis]